MVQETLGAPQPPGGELGVQNEASLTGKSRDFGEHTAQAAVAVTEDFSPFSLELFPFSPFQVLDVTLWLHLMLGRNSSPRFPILGTSEEVLAQSKRTAQ